MIVPVPVTTMRIDVESFENVIVTESPSTSWPPSIVYPASVNAFVICVATASAVPLPEYKRVVAEFVSSFSPVGEGTSAGQPAAGAGLDEGGALCEAESLTVLGAGLDEESPPLEQPAAAAAIPIVMAMTLSRCFSFRLELIIGTASRVDVRNARRPDGAWPGWP